jgi:hypothetical protein
MRPLAAKLLFAACAASVAAGGLGCDKIPGLGKKDADGGTASGGGGGVLSFLGGTFEGEITMSVGGAGGPGAAAAAPGQPPATMVFGIRSPKFRIDTLGNVGASNPLMGEGAGMIIDPPAKKAFFMMPAQKKAMVIDFDKMKSMRAGAGGAAGQPGGAAPNETPKIDKTGQKEVIAGYECETWKVTSKSGRADMCVAEGIKWIDLGELGMASPQVALAAVAADANRFPLRVVAYDDKNVETTRMQATKIEKKKLDEARFVVPPDYQLIDMSAMLGGLQGLGGGKGGMPSPAILPPGMSPPQPKRR